MESEKSIDQLLSSAFSSMHVKSALRHFRSMVERLQVIDFENSIAKGGKFLEAVLKAMYLRAGRTLPPSRDFRVDKIINELGQTDRHILADTLRLLIPRACRFAYDIASNRGGRHDAGEIDSNAMDATIMVSTCSWILAEMIRFSQAGSVRPEQAQAIVSGLMERRYPLIEEVEGRIYFHKREKSARDVALIGLWRKYPERMTRKELMEMILRHGFTKNNAEVVLTRIKLMVDDDGMGNLKLLNPGIEEAEKLVSSSSFA